MDNGQAAECERFGDFHRRAVSDHFQLLAAIESSLSEFRFDANLLVRE